MDHGKKQGKLVIMYSLLGICIAAMIFFAYGVIKELYVRGQGKAFYTTLSTSQPVTTTTKFTIDFETLREQIPDVIAWIKCEDIGVDFPIVQGNDNDYYLGRLPNGESNYMGSIFMDYRNSADFSDKNSLIYGHALTTGDMFTVIKNYQSQAFYDDNPVFSLFTPEKDYELVLFAGYILDSSIISEVPPISFANEETLLRYLEEAQQRSTFWSNVGVDANDTLVTLATCAYPRSVYRYVLLGKLNDM